MKEYLLSEYGSKLSPDVLMKPFLEHKNIHGIVKEMNLSNKSLTSHTIN